ncbi:hypothetical protein ACFX1R_041917 [Malus domestica]
MNRAPHMRQDRPNLGQDLCAQTPVKANLLEHVNALDNFSCPHSVLSSNFIFSSPTQKPLAEEAMVSGRKGCIVLVMFDGNLTAAIAPRFVVKFLYQYCRPCDVQIAREFEKFGNPRASPAQIEMDAILDPPTR